MGKEYPPLLTQDELNGAADAAAAIVTRCNMVDEDGFVGPAGMLDRISRNVTRRVPIELNLEKICTALAHPTIRRVLGVFGFKFQQYKGHGDRFYHKSSGQQFWMHRQQYQRAPFAYCGL